MSILPRSASRLCGTVRRSVANACAAILAVSSVAGCASSPSGPTYLSVPHAQYDRVFDAACAAARDEGFVPEVTDRNAGAIESAPKFAGSAIEPWTWGTMTADDVVEGTFGFERRRARFEFVPAGFRPTAPEGTAPLAGPILPGSERGKGADLTRAEGELEVRVSVSVERQFRPGYQGGAYTRALGSYSRDVTMKDDPATPRDRSTWTAVARDERMERALIDRLAKRLAEATTASAPDAK
ncbi:MAG: hypothetical protein RLY21_369 [Planctomycetota bacterium]|jgi:hypothetical protein